MSGKGDRRRPNDPQKFSEGYDRIFGKKPAKKHNESISEKFYRREATLTAS